MSVRTCVRESLHQMVDTKVKHYKLEYYLAMVSTFLAIQYEDHLVISYLLLIKC
jgi:hypothetical protein